MHQYLQGSHVDVPSYYKSLAATSYDKLLIKSGFPEKAKSNIEVGDRFYFNGPHMWQTTYKESFQKGKGAIRSHSRNANQADKPEVLKLVSKHDRQEKAYKYKMLAAIVGQRRLDHLEKLVRSKLSQLTNTGGHEAVDMFKVYDIDGSGYIGADEFMYVSRDLGIHITPTEASALFGRYDRNRDNEVTFYEFLDEFLNVGNLHQAYYER